MINDKELNFLFSNELITKEEYKIYYSNDFLTCIWNDKFVIYDDNHKYVKGVNIDNNLYLCWIREKKINEILK